MCGDFKTRQFLHPLDFYCTYFCVRQTHPFVACKIFISSLFTIEMSTCMFTHKKNSNYFCHLDNFCSNIYETVCELFSDTYNFFIHIIVGHDEKIMRNEEWMGLKAKFVLAVQFWVCLNEWTGRIKPDIINVYFWFVIITQCLWILCFQIVYHAFHILQFMDCEEVKFSNSQFFVRLCHNTWNLLLIKA